MTASHLFIDLILICFIILVYIYRLAYQSKSRIFFDPTWSGLSSWFRSDCPVVRLHVKYLYLTCIHFGFAFETIAWKWTCWPLWGSLGPGWLRMLKIITLSRLICQHTLAASHMPMFNFSVTAQCLHTLLCHVAYSCVMKWRWCNDVPSQTLDINVIRLFSSFRSFQKKVWSLIPYFSEGLLLAWSESKIFAYSIWWLCSAKGGCWRFRVLPPSCFISYC